MKIGAQQADRGRRRTWWSL